MVTEEQLKMCKNCANQRFDDKDEIVCLYTNKAPDFKESCVLYVRDPEAQGGAEFDYLTKGADFKSARGYKRFINFVVDWILVNVVVFVIGSIIGSVVVFVIAMSAGDRGSSLLSDATSVKAISYIIAFVVATLYYTLVEYLTKGRSVGKFITKTRVITADGEMPGFKTLLIRSIARFIPLEMFSFFGSEDAGWHDSISGTRVVDISADKEIDQQGI